ncbi:MAG: lysyl oxidase-like [Myxococcales bacterium]|nr:lysyl oxidase-like [Myxococcales bacterium]
MTCEVSDGSGAIDAPLADMAITDGCVPAREYCGDGIDQDCDGIDPTCPPNDRPNSSTDVTAGGTFTADLTYAHEDAPGPGSMSCGFAGGRDVFYRVGVFTDETYYIDTFGSDFDTSIRVFHNISCASVTGATNGAICRNDMCGTLQSQYAGTMSGENCIVITQHSSNETKGHLVLHVERGNRKGYSGLLTGTVTLTGSTCNGINDYMGNCGGAGPNIDYFTTGCPGQTQNLTATTCSAATLIDTSLFVLGPGSTQIACNDDDAACTASGADSTIPTVQLVGAHLFWVIVDMQTAGGCGTYSLTATLN